MLNANQFKRLVKLGDYVRIFLDGKLTINGFLFESSVAGNPNDHFRLESGDIKTGNILFDDIYQFEIYRKVNDEIKSV